MNDLLPDAIAGIVDGAHGELDPLRAEMTAYGREQVFPTVGPAAGLALRLFADLVDATRVFEFGSGFGYSAVWFLAALPDTGEIVLTDYDADNLAKAETFLDRVESDATIRYEPGDARETFQGYDGGFDVVLIDNDKDQYIETLDLVTPRLSDGGLVIADNMIGGPFDAADVNAALAGDGIGGTAGDVAAYIAYVRDETPAESLLLPLGEGLLVSRF